MWSMMADHVDGGILVFESTHPKWSFAKLNNEGYVCEVAEKRPISNLATVGIYFWRKGSDYVKYAEQMIQKNIRVNNEFYVCPVFNEAIQDGKKIKVFKIANDKMWGIGTPEDLSYFLENHP
jgi:dTDP-glucose pyrophosphorylase